MPTKSSKTKIKLPFPSKLPKLILSSIVKLNIVYVLGILLIVASFLIGILVTKVSYLEKGAGTTTISDQTLGDSEPQAPTGPVDVKEGHLPILGNKDAKVTVIEFADFQCPFCERYHKEITPSLKKDYIDGGKIKFAFRHYAFLGQESTDAALASECANEQEKFWEFHDYLFENQSGENQGAFAKDKLKEFAIAVGLNSTQFNECLDSAKYKDNVDKDIAEGGKAGVNGTPATFVNGILISGAVPYAELKTEIEKALAQ